MKFYIVNISLFHFFYIIQIYIYIYIYIYSDRNNFISLKKYCSMNTYIFFHFKIMCKVTPCQEFSQIFERINKYRQEK